jgi:large subunit ribosomal protein L30
MSKEKNIRVTLVKSPIGYNRSQRATVEALGLRKMQASKIHKVTPQVEGMIYKVRHLLRVEEVED